MDTLKMLGEAIEAVERSEPLFARSYPAMIEGLKAKVARNDVGEAIGIRAEYHHNGRMDCLGIGLEEPSEDSNEAIIAAHREQLDKWAAEMRAKAKR